MSQHSKHVSQYALKINLYNFPRIEMDSLNEQR